MRVGLVKRGETVGRSLGEIEVRDVAPTLARFLGGRRSTMGDVLGR